MNRSLRRTLGRLVAALGLGLVGGSLPLLLATTSAEPDAPPNKGPGLVPDRAPEWQGTASCATAACHGGFGLEGDVRSAYTIWKGLDPHSRAYSVLEENLSAEIEAALAAPTGQEPRSAVADVRCLRCHVHPDVETPPLASASLRRLGVSCEGCHAPAEQWLEPHKRFEEWQKQTDEQKSAMGLKRLKDLTVQAELCAGCHVGGPGRDVDHDLIAAGHPRLNFELHAFLDSLPKHWSTAPAKARVPEYEALLWSVGQVASARAALEQLAARALAAKEGKRPWPEFAEYACASCHHDLADTSWSHSQGLGLPLWGTWYLPALAPLARTIPGANREEWEKPYQALRRLMSDPSPDPEKVEHLATELAQPLGKWLGLPLRELRFDRRGVSQLLDSCLVDAQDRSAKSWDEAAQLGLASYALDRALHDSSRPKDPEAQAALREMLHALEGPSLQAPQSDPKGPSAQERFNAAVDRLRKRLNP
jgi:hypothetical protein